MNERLSVERQRLLAEKYIDANVALRKCKHLQQHPSELAVNKIGNYQYIGSRPVTMLANLMKQFGTSSDSKSNRVLIENKYGITNYNP
jgi:hypothetical protein